MAGVFLSLLDLWPPGLIITLAVLLCSGIVIKWIRRGIVGDRSHGGRSWNLDTIRGLVDEHSIALPAMFVDLDVFEANVRRLAGKAEQHGKTLRLATKSVRVPQLIAHALKHGGPRTMKGLMCFSVPEAALLAEELGCDDMLVAYPCVQRPDLEAAWRLTEKGIKISLMIDCAKHVQLLGDFVESVRGRQNNGLRLRVCIDVDMSYSAIPGFHFGVHRSPVRRLDDFKGLVEAVLQRKSALELTGVMAYEAQIAGLQDANPFQPLLMPVVRLLQRLSLSDVRRRRREVADFLAQKGVRLEFFNGGGTGSIHLTPQEPWLTEVTVGSGLLQSHLFDYFVHNENECAMCYGLSVTRRPSSRDVVCQSGGFMASGNAAAESAPVVFLPAGVSPYPLEGFGEVQSPLQVPSHVRLDIGDIVLLRPAKAGEIAERFNEYVLFRGSTGELVNRVPTYRGLGFAFY